jgi:aryl-alcohol dehydrogenase-like predicted oxidoreductase
MAALTDVVQQGKVRYIGFSEWTPTQIAAALGIDHSVPFVSSQPQYSMLWRDPEAQVFPLCSENGIGQIVWSPLAQGILSGKYLPGELPATGTRVTNSKMNGYLLRELYCDATLTAVQNLHPVAASLGLTMPQFALAWVLQKDSVASAIIGASRPEQVLENAVASGITIAPEVMQTVDQILSPVFNRRDSP